MFVCLMVLYTTFNNILVISWRSILLVEETEGPGENQRPVASHWQTLHIMLYTSPWSRFELTTSVMIGSDYIGSCKSSYHTITVTTAPIMLYRVHLTWTVFELTTSVMIGTDCIGSCKSNYHTITTTTALNNRIDVTQIFNCFKRRSTGIDSIMSPRTVVSVD